MSFAFGFSGDDISDTETADAFVEKSQSVSGPAAPDTAAISPQVHMLEDLLATLTNVRLTFDNYSTPNDNIVYRRQLFDIKHQVMTEEGETKNEVHDILIGKSADEVDVQKNVYEGGFKSWECSYDLVDKLDVLFAGKKLQSHKSLLELGCGTALPTCYLLMLLFNTSSATQLSTFILSDFNYEVLRLVTLPNILIHYASTLPPKTLYDLMDPGIPLTNEELLLTPAFLQKFTSDLQEKGIQLKFISGSWGTEFMDIITPFECDLVLTSETIYSPESSPLISDMLVNLFAKKCSYLGLVAAKEYYFGVGGSLKGFLDDLNSRKPASMLVERTSEELGQLKRDIISLQPEI